MLPVTPRGFKDVLPKEARWREAITTQMQQVMSSWGYAPIETPTLEVLQVLEAGSPLTQQPFRLFDSDGALLVLRPDVTLPIARMVASRLREETEPLRFRYVQPVFREEERLRGQAREFTQIGGEYIGATGAAADAEILLLLAEALQAVGLVDFQIAVGTVGVLKDLLAAAQRCGGCDQDWREAMLAAFHNNNLVDIAELSALSAVPPDIGVALRALPNINGGQAAIGLCQELVEPLGCSAGLEQLSQTLGIVSELDGGDSISVDFSVVSAFDYYTGLVFEVYAPGSGLALGGGGRYDSTLAAFGADRPAAGFAVYLERIMAALSVQAAGLDEAAFKPACEYVPLDVNDPVVAFRQAAELRKAGRRAVLGSCTEGAAR
ncbi:MAG: ATP phosphoribosyltransferase regulatory subunit [Coriobacteriales bacterium]|jgi:ATP phosphoribosyltransferase regulatory subunit|nr:ATP phosphoribosyltransferase regulatory subunit [Coriobacteriales bacterium]